MKWLFVVILCGACSGGGFKSPTNRDAEEIVLVGEDLVLRHEHDNTITAIATRQLGETIATGAVRLRAPDLQGARNSPHLRLARARAFQAMALKLAADHGASFDAAMLGIKEVGEQYGLPHTLDDTGLSVKVSEGQRNDPEKLPYAAERLRRVLRSRLRMYATRYKADLL